MMPGVFFQLQFETVKRYLYTQTVFYPPLYIQTCTTIFHIFLCYILVVILPFGTGGAIVAFSMTYFFNFIFVFFYARRYNFIDSFNIFSLPMSRQDL